MATVNLSNVVFDQKRKTLIASSSLFGCCFPDVVDVYSHHTNRVMSFVKDYDAAMNAEFWDGEMYEYKINGVDTSNGKVNRLVVCFD